MAAFIELISEIPIIGPWVKFIVLLVPPVIVIGLLGIGHVSLMCLVCAAWLYILEKWLNIKAVIPLINLPWLWIFYAGIVVGLFSYNQSTGAAAVRAG